jgi:hypothetical protein
MNDVLGSLEREYFLVVYISSVTNYEVERTPPFSFFSTLK